MMNADTIRQLIEEGLPQRSANRINNLIDQRKQLFRIKLAEQNLGRISYEYNRTETSSVTNTA